MGSHMGDGRVRCDWEGLRIFRAGRRFSATKGGGSAELGLGEGFGCGIGGKKDARFDGRD